MKKKMLSLLLAATMFVSTATNVYAASDITVDTISFDEDLIDENDIEIKDVISEENDDEASLDSDDNSIGDSLVIIDESDDASSDSSSDDASESASDSSSDASSTAASSGATERILSYHEIPVDEHLESVLDGAEGTASLDGIVNNTYDAKYITPNLPSLRDQGWYGTCWAHTMMALADINLIKKGLISNADTSELHMAYFTYNTVVDPLGGTEGDDNKISGSNSWSGWLTEGGNVALAVNIAANWLGAADEATAPYEDAGSAAWLGLDKSIAYKDVAHLTNYYREKIDLTNLNPVKELIVRHGAVSLSYYSYSGDQYDAISAKVYNLLHNCYYNVNAPSTTNHVVTVVGWDDNFSKDNFAVKPQGDGAWLVRNSWTTGQKNSYDGYFWMSYYEPSIYEYVFATDYQKANNYDNNYQYDGGMLSLGIPAAKGANVFTSQAPNGKSEELKAVSFATSNSNVNYTVKVYTGLTKASNPESGTLAATVKGSTDYAGYYTVPLNKTISLPKGTKFSVVVELSKPGDTTYIDAEYGYTDWFTTTTAIKDGQSFIYNDSWQDVKNTNYSTKDSFGNLRIKAFTSNSSNTASYKITLDPQGGKVSTKSITVKSGTYSNLPTPTRTGYTFKSWNTKPDGTGTTVKNGSALAKKANHTLYAQWKVASYKVTFESNGGSAVTAQTVKYDTKNKKYGVAKKPADPTKKGYTFKGWYSDKELKTAYNFNTQVKKSFTLYAKWTANKYTVTFKSNGGKGTMKNLSFTYGKSQKLTKNSFKRTGYTFTGWNTKADGSGKTYTNAQSVKNLSSKSGGKVTLYAQWKKNSK